MHLMIMNLHVPPLNTGFDFPTKVTNTINQLPLRQVIEKADDEAPSFRLLSNRSSYGWTTECP